MRAFAIKGQADGGYTTTEKALGGRRNAAILKSRWRKWKKIKL